MLLCSHDDMMTNLAASLSQRVKPRNHHHANIIHCLVLNIHATCLIFTGICRFRY